MNKAEILDALEKAVQLCRICSDWNLYEVEINDEMVSIYDLRDQFQEVIDNASGA